MSIKPISIPKKKLSQSITSASSSFILNNITGWDGEDLEAADLGTQHFCVFINDTGTAIEIMEIDPATIASASITILKRGLEFNGSQTEVAENKLDWTANETTVLLGTDAPQLLAQYVDDSTNQTIDGVKTFADVPVTTGGDPISSNDLTRKAYVDALVLGTLTTINVIVPGTAGTTVAAGNLIYYDDATNRWLKTDADTAATVEGVLLGIAQGAGTSGNPILNGVLLQGVDANQSGLTEGQTYYASNTAGAISSSAGTNSVVVGIGGQAADELYFAPRFNQQVTANQIAAMAGNGGTPSATNKFTTQAGFQAGAETYAADSVGSDAYAITLSPAIAAYANGQVFRFKAGTANTGAATLAVNGLAAKAIVKRYNVALATGDILAGQIVEVQYESVGDNFQMLSPSSITPGTVEMIAQSGAATTSSVANTNENNLVSVEIPANSLGTGNSVRFKLSGTFNSTTQNDAITLRWKFGATTFASHAVTYNGAATYLFEFEFLLTANAATNAQQSSGSMIITQFTTRSSGSGTLFSTPVTIGYRGGLDNTGTEDSTASKNLIFSTQLNSTGGAGGASITYKTYTIELLK